MSEELLRVLTRFHREIAMPDMERLLARLEKKVDAHHDEFLSFADATMKRFDRLETEYHAIVEGLRRVEGQVERLEARVANLEATTAEIARKIETLALRSELEEVKERVRVLEDRIAELYAADTSRSPSR